MSKVGKYGFAIGGLLLVAIVCLLLGAFTGVLFLVGFAAVAFLAAIAAAIWVYRRTKDGSA